MRNGRRRAKDERMWKGIYAEAKARDDIRAAEKKKQNEQMAAKCNNFEINRADGYSIDQYKTDLDKQISNFAQVKAQSERYNAAPKLSCKRANMTLPNGERISGIWKIVSAYHILPSHNPETFADSQNFPLNSEGRNVNDRNYSKDRMAQSFVQSVAARFDGRAIEEPIRISKDGVVVDGNNRTMSRILAHKQNTDLAYIEALHDLASEKCMCHDDIAQIEAPTMVFEIDSAPSYTRQYFAQFNANTKKEKTTVDQVITLASTVSQRVRNIINAEFDKYENISELYSSRPSVQAIRNALIDGGVIMESEFNKYFDATIGSFTDDGKKMLQRIVLSGILSEDNVRVLDTDGMKNINEKLLYAIVSVTVNQSMPEEFSLKSEMNAAIDILHSASRASMSVADLISQGSMFAETEVKADYESLAVAVFISKSKAQFKKIMNVYNTAAKGVQGGSLFGEVDNRDKRQILKDTIEWMLTEKMLTDADKYALQRFEKLEAKPKTVVDMLPSARRKLSEGEKVFLTKQVKKETEKQAKPTPSVPKEQNDFEKIYIQDLVRQATNTNDPKRLTALRELLVISKNTDDKWLKELAQKGIEYIDKELSKQVKPPPSVKKPKIYLEIGKTYKTRGGYTVKIIDEDSNKKRPFAGTIMDKNEVIRPASFKFNGVYGDKESEFDIIEEITPSLSKAQTLINDLKQALKYIKDNTKLEKYTALVFDLELAAKYAK